MISITGTEKSVLFVILLFLVFQFNLRDDNDIMGETQRKKRRTGNEIPIYNNDSIVFSMGREHMVIPFSNLPHGLNSIQFLEETKFLYFLKLIDKIHTPYNPKDPASKLLTSLQHFVLDDPDLLKCIDNDIMRMIKQEFHAESQMTCELYLELTELKHFGPTDIYVLIYMNFWMMYLRSFIGLPSRNIFIKKLMPDIYTKWITQHQLPMINLLLRYWILPTGTKLGEKAIKIQYSI